MKIRIADIRWEDKDGNRLDDEAVRRMCLPVNWTLDLDVPESMPRDKLWRICCSEIEDTVFREDVAILDMTILGDGQDWKDAWPGAWTTIEAARPQGPRMMWVRAGAFRKLINIDMIYEINDWGDGHHIAVVLKYHDRDECITIDQHDLDRILDQVVLVGGED